MKGFLKRLSILTAALLLLCAMPATVSAASAENCPGGCSHQAAIGTTHYDTLAEALSVASDGNTVTVLKDISDAGVMTVSSAITLDLGGKTLSGTIDPTKSLVNAEKDLTITNGTLSCSNSMCLYAVDCVVTVDQSATLRSPMCASGINGTVTVNFNGTFHSDSAISAMSTSAVNSANCIINIGDTAVISAKGGVVAMYGNGQLNITGGTFTTQKHAIALDIPDDHAIAVSITGGKFQIDDDEIVVITKETNATAPEKFITGGAYNKDPSPWIADNHRVNDNGDGTYTVVAQKNISFDAGSGTGTMTGTTADLGSPFTLPGCTMTAPAGKHFGGWEIGGTIYPAGTSITVNSDLSAKATWANHSGGYATCLSKASCSVCGATYGDYSGHSLVSYGGSAATCTESGSLSHSRCTTCGSYFQNGVSVYASGLTVSALGHELKPVAGKAATCTEEGLLAHEKCTRCDVLQIKGKAVTEEELVIPAMGHKLQKVAAKEATCTEAGMEKHESCSVCKALFANGKAVNKKDLTTETLSHVLSHWESDSATHWKTCVGCGDIFRQHSHKDGTGDGSCDECGYVLVAPEAEEAQKEEKVSFPFWIPIIAAVIVATGGMFIATGKKSK